MTKCPAAPPVGMLAKCPVFVASPLTFAVPSKASPKIFREVASAVAVATFEVVRATVPLAFGNEMVRLAVGL